MARPLHPVLLGSHLTCERPLVDPLQDGGHTEEGIGQIEVPVLDDREAHVATVHPEVLFCGRDPQLSQVKVTET